jgi:hypothetical protein
LSSFQKGEDPPETHPLFETKYHTMRFTVALSIYYLYVVTERWPGCAVPV